MRYDAKPYAVKQMMILYIDMTAKATGSDVYMVCIDKFTAPVRTFDCLGSACLLGEEDHHSRDIQARK